MILVLHLRSLIFDVLISFQPALLAGNGNIIFFHATRTVPFSGPLSSDVFNLTAYGADTLNAHIIFLIQNSVGDTIWRDSLTSASFCGTGYDPDFPNDLELKPEARKRRLFERMESFFSEANFLKPAMPYNEPFGGECLDSLACAEFSRDSTVIGFVYSPYRDLRIDIGYSRTRRAVIKYQGGP